MTDEARDPTSSEPELDLPPGLELERLGPSEERVRVRYTLGNRVLLALPRIVLFVSVLFALAQAWRHHVFIAFWLFGLPFLRWLSGPARGSLLIGPNRLELEGACSAARSCCPARALPRSAWRGVTRCSSISARSRCAR